MLTSFTKAPAPESGKMQPIATLALVLAVVVAFIIYRPDRDLPFDNLDFSEFLPILQSSESFWERTRELTRHYANQAVQMSCRTPC
jgi:hypothetical protein